jgi:hypothetical protein
MNLGQSVWGRVVICITLSSYVGCMTMTPLMGGPCRDPATGRFVSCGGGSSSSGGSDSTGWIVLGIAAAAAAIGGIIYLATLRPGPDPASAASTPTSSSNLQPAEPPCILPDVRAVRVCQSSRGYRFALPPSSPCGAGSTDVGSVPITCSALWHPAYHACLNGAGEWSARPSWETCASAGLVDAPGDFVPPGRSPTQGVSP